MEKSSALTVRDPLHRYTIEDELTLQANEKAAGIEPLKGTSGTADAALQAQKDKMWKDGLEAIAANPRNSFDDLAFGCLLGAFAGDACGSYLEFSEQTASDYALTLCMTMSGGGPHKTAGGQVTDDSEMAMALLKALADANDRDDIAPDADKKVFNFELVGYYYYEWFDSDPFDCGNTIFNSIQRLGHSVQACYQSVRKYNLGKSNGSLMRCTPLAIWCAQFEKDKNYEAFYTAAAADVRFVHCHDVVIDSVFLYELAIAHLLNNPTGKNRCREAFDLAFKLS